MTQTEKGIFTQTPDVLLMTCDLPDEAIMLFNRLYCLTKFKGGIFYGSIRKLALAVNVKRDKAHRNLKALADSGLADTGASSELDVSAIKLNLDDLWELNIAFKAGVEIPRWTNLQKALECVRKIGQPIEEQPKIETDLEESSVRKIGQDDRNLGQNSAKIGQDDRNLGHFVRRSELNVSTKNSKSNKNQEDKRESKATASAFASHKPTQPTLPLEEKKPPARGRPPKPAVTLDTPEQEQFWSLWCQVWFNQEVKPTLNQTAKDHVVNLAGRFKTQDQLDSYEKFTRKELAESGQKRKTIYLGTLDNNDRYIRWKQTQPTPAPKVTSLPEKRKSQAERLAELEADMHRDWREDLKGLKAAVNK